MVNLYVFVFPQLEETLLRHELLLRFALWLDTTFPKTDNHANVQHFSGSALWEKLYTMTIWNRLKLPMNTP